MSNTRSPLKVDFEEEVAIDFSSKDVEKYALSAYGLEIYTHQSAILKEKVDEIALDISQRQDRIKFLHEVLQAINKLSDENGLDIGKHSEMISRLKIAKEFGIDLDPGQTKYTAQERDFLKESLHMAAEDYNNENKLQTQKMQMLIQESDRWLMLANTMVKTDERIKKRILDKLR